MSLFDYFREPSFDELIVHHLEYIEAWGEEEASEPEIKWYIHMSLVTVRILAKLRDQQKSED